MEPTRLHPYPHDKPKHIDGSAVTHVPQKADSWAGAPAFVRLRYRQISCRIYHSGNSFFLGRISFVPMIYQSDVWRRFLQRWPRPDWWYSSSSLLLSSLEMSDTKVYEPQIWALFGQVISKWKTDQEVASTPEALASESKLRCVHFGVCSGCSAETDLDSGAPPLPIYIYVYTHI